MAKGLGHTKILPYGEEIPNRPFPYWRPRKTLPHRESGTDALLDSQLLEPTQLAEMGRPAARNVNPRQATALTPFHAQRIFGFNPKREFSRGGQDVKDSQKMPYLMFDTKVP
ncbi:MAG: hypothetical protein WCG66_02460 [bacterium]